MKHRCCERNQKSQLWYVCNYYIGSFQNFLQRRQVRSRRTQNRVHTRAFKTAQKRKNVTKLKTGRAKLSTPITCVTNGGRTTIHAGRAEFQNEARMLSCRRHFVWSFPTQAYSTTDSTNHWCTPLSRTTLKDSMTLPPPRLSLLGWQQQKTSAKEAEGGTFPASKRKTSTPSSPSSVGSKAIRYLPWTASVHSGHASQSVQVPHFSNPSYR